MDEETKKACLCIFGPPLIVVVGVLVALAVGQGDASTVGIVFYLFGIASIMSIGIFAQWSPKKRRRQGRSTYSIEHRREYDLEESNVPLELRMKGFRNE
jgi:uncharacterized membrane protein YuzA (DUF378 family)